jgi:hypothetical protein
VDTQSIRKTLAALTQESFQLFGAALFLALLVFVFSLLFRKPCIAGAFAVSAVCDLSLVCESFQDTDHVRPRLRYRILRSIARRAISPD